MGSLKPEKTPSLFGVYVIAALMAWFGGLLGFAYLTIFPLQSYGRMAEYEAARAEAEAEEPYLPKPGNGFYIEGEVLASRSWEQKRERLSASGPQTVSLSAGEMNAWMDARFSSAGPASGAEKSNLVLVPGVPNFAAVEGQGFYVNLPLTVIFFGNQFECVLSALGEVSADGFEAKSVSLNSAAIPWPSVIGDYVLKTLAEAFQSSEDYKIVSGALDRAESVSMEASTLTLELR